MNLEESFRMLGLEPGRPPILGQQHVIPSCGMKMNWVATGRFLMGSPQAETGRSNDEGPQTVVTISSGFWLGTFAVTQNEWKAVAETTTGLNDEPSFFRGGSLPVEQVSWDHCQEWLAALNRLEEGRLPDGFGFRLPTEAEWEYACRAGTSTRFHFGESDAPLADHGWFCGNSGSHPHPVGEKKPNDWDFYDMHGNVWEWCFDRYGGPHSGENQTDPKGPPLGLNRVFRGGAWGIAASRCRAAYRVWNRPDYRDHTIGFRAALGPAK